MLRNDYLNKYMTKKKTKRDFLIDEKIKLLHKTVRFCIVFTNYSLLRCKLIL